MAFNEEFLGNQPATETNSTYWLPNLHTTTSGGSFASERDLEIAALKKQYGKNNNAFMWGMQQLDEHVYPFQFDKVKADRKAQREKNSPPWLGEAILGGAEKMGEAPFKIAGYFLTSVTPLIANSYIALRALSGAAGPDEAASKYVVEAHKGVDAFNKKLEKFFGLDTAAKESPAADFIGKVTGSVMSGGVLPYAAVAFGLNQGTETFAKQKEGGASNGEAFWRAGTNALTEAGFESFQINRVFGALAKKSRPMAIVKDVFENAVQEVAQDASTMILNQNVDKKTLEEAYDELKLSAAGGGLAALMGSAGGWALSPKAVEKTEAVIDNLNIPENKKIEVKEALKSLTPDELAMAAKQVANDELTTMALTYKEHAEYAANQIVGELNMLIGQNELVAQSDMSMPSSYQLGEIKVDTAENPNLGQLLFQMEQEGNPAKNFADVLKVVENKIDVAGNTKTISELGEVREAIKERIVKEGNYGEEYADKAADLAVANVYALSKMFKMSPKEYYEARFPSVQKKAYNAITKQIEEADYIPFQRDIQNLVKKAKEPGTFKDNVKFGKVADWLVQQANEHGLDIAGYEHSIDVSAIKHIKNFHGDKKTEAPRGQIAITDKDIQLAPVVVSNPDYIAFGAKNRQNNEAIVYAKKMDDGSMIFVEEVRTKRKTLSANTMWKMKTDITSQSLLPIIKQHLRSDNVSIDIIQNPSENVKQNFQGEGNPLGAFDPKNNIIYLFETANRSTFVHEMSHFFMDEILDAANQGIDQAIQLKNKMDKWLNHKEGPYTTEQKEKFARGFEAYLWEGEAPNKEMTGVFKAFKQWLRDIYRSLGRLKVRLSKDVRGVYADMLGGSDIDMLYQTDSTIKALDDKVGALEQEAEEAAQAQIEYAKQAAEQMAELSQEKWSAMKAGKEWLDIKTEDMSGVHKTLTQIFTPLSTRAKALDPSIALRIRQMMHDEGQFINGKMQKIKPLLDGVAKMSKADIARFDSYMKNGVESGLEGLFEKYNLKEKYASYREAMDEIYQAAESVGIQMNYRDTYAPRKIKNTSKFLDHIHSSNAGLFSQMLAELGNAATEAEQADWLDQHLRSWGVTPDPMKQTPGNVKNRKIQVIDAELDKYYYTTPEAISMYVDGMAKAISMRAIWGATPDMSSDGMTNEGLNKSIGEVVAGLRAEGKITTNEQAKEMKDILNSLLGNHGTQPKWLSRLKTGAMASMLTKGLQTISQLADVGTSVYSNGIKNTLSSFAGHDITLDMVGIEKLTEEYRHKDSGAKLLDFFFTWSGFNKMDVWGKQTFLNAKYKSLVEQATKAPDKLQAYLEPMFEERTGRLMDDLKNKRMSQDVNLLLFSELSEIQPTTMAEMPSGYVNNPNARLWYMLKTFSLRRLDFILNETYRMYRSGQGVQATKNLISLAICVGGAETLVALLKDWLRGKELNVADTAVDSLMGMFMLNRYQMWKLRSSGPEGFIATLLPPVAPMATAIFEDLPKIADGKLTIKDARVWTYMPLLGDAYYWWLGGGHTKEQKKKRKR